MKKVFSFVFSMQITGMLIMVFALAIAYATFVENDFGTPTARLLIYNAWWFEVLLLLLSINLGGSIVVNKLVSRKRWPVFLFHFGFLVILAGAAVTRYTGFEGMMHIREGESSSRLIASTKSLKISARSNREEYLATKDLMLSPNFANRFSKTFKLNHKKITIKLDDYLPHATKTLVEGPNGVPMISLLAMDMHGHRDDFVLEQNKQHRIGNVVFSFDYNSPEAQLRIREENGTLVLNAIDSVFVSQMGLEGNQQVAPGQPLELMPRTIYRTGDITFVIKKYIKSGILKLVSVPAPDGTPGSNALQFSVSVDNETNIASIFETNSHDEPTTFKIGDTEIDLSYASAVIQLPFSLKLHDFQLERYPGSNSPSSFASEVMLIDQAHNINRPYRIFMNNILKYQGYRFFQSSYDQDEEGTVLSVNYDAAGTIITYIGYFLMTLGMILSLFARSSRFRRLAGALGRISNKSSTQLSGIVLIAFLVSYSHAFAQGTPGVSIEEHEKKFRRLQVLGADGRIEPINTLASELLRKIARKTTFNGKTATQILIEITANSQAWLTVPIIKVSNPEIQRHLGIRSEQASFADFFQNDHESNYKLQEFVEKAYEKKLVQRSRFDKEIIAIDERVNVLYGMLNGTYLTIFPVPGDPNNKWTDFHSALSHNEALKENPALKSMQNYLHALMKAEVSKDYSQANTYLDQLIDFQKTAGAAIHPPRFKTWLEIHYINLNIYSRLAILYIFFGLLLLIYQITTLMSPVARRANLAKIVFWIILGLLLIHTMAMAARWYITDHAPWSNGYETLLYISWTSALAGLVFARRSPITLAVTAILAAITLFVAGMSWMNPELTNLVPVLKSYWLIIHVSVITASYGFLGTGALLGLTNLLLIISRTSYNSARVGFTVKELSYIIEIALILGLYLLTIGSFLGGVWANESWGRYWGWDPKETWSLVTILIYSFITHMHKIPGLRGQFALSAAALAGFSSVLMTYFGVNYYLSGLHSYAQGDPAPVPAGVYVAVVVVLMVISLAFASQKKHQIRSDDEISEADSTQ